MVAVIPELKFRMAFRRLQQQRGEEVMAQYVTPLITEMMVRMQSHSRYAGVAQGYYMDVRASYNRMYFNIYNTSRLWAVEERGAVPHEIPQPAHGLPPVKFYNWVEQRSIPPSMWFWLNKVRLPGAPYTAHHPGLPGRYTAEYEFDRSEAAIYDAFRLALDEMVRLGGTLEDVE